MITSASVKVMRSYDYCHFEVSLTFEHESHAAVDEMRKEAARLVDKAVNQYITAKANTQRIENDEQRKSNLKWNHDNAMKVPDSERTPDQKAHIKAYQDSLHRHRPRYDYSDEWSEPEYEEEENDVAF
jgi:hypothetical protein